MSLLKENRGGGASAFTSLSDAPSAIQALQALRGNPGATALEFYTPTETAFAWHSDWVNVMSYGAAGVVTTTTLAATLNVGSTSATLTSASSFSLGHGMTIPGAGVAGVDLVVKITNVAGNVVTFTPATSTTVTSATIHHDDTQAFNDAKASLKHVYAPRGNYNVSSTLSFTNNYQSLLGAGIYGTTMIYSRVLNGDTLLFGAGHSTLSDLCVTMDPTLTPTSGALIVGGNAASPRSHISLNNVCALNGYVGLRLDAGNNPQLVNILVSNCRQYGMHVNVPIPYGGGCVDRIIIHRDSSSWAAGALSGLYITEQDTSRWSNINITGYPILMHFNATGGGIAQTLFTNVILENQEASAAYSIKMEKSGGSLLQNIGISRLEIQPISGGGTVYIGLGAESISVNGFTSESVNGRSFEVYGTNVHISEGFCRRSSGATDAIYLGTGASKVTVSNVSANGFTTGITIANNVTGCNIHDNNFSGCTTGASIGTGVRATAKIHDNIGINDWITSVAATPEFIGQESLLAGQFYRAVGTSSSADWKQITV